MTYLPPILRIVNGLGYAVFAGSRDFDLNIVGLRRNVSHRKPDLYSDDLFVFWQEGKSWRCFNAAMSTTPGNYYLAHPMRPNSGCAIMAEGQYRGAYIRGLHKGKPGLLQRGSRVRYYRDNNRDTVLDLDPSTLQSGFAGLNIHRGSANSDRVGKYSAGCQVMHPNDMDTLLNLCKKQEEVNGRGFDRFTYTLIGEDDL